MKPDDFTATYGPLAEDISQETGLAPHAILGIVAQETGFGDHFIGNNIFGISPSGPRGQYVAQYPSIQDAGRAFVDLIKSRYQDASSGATPEDQVRLISARGYNTNPAYPGAVSQRIATLKGSGQQQVQSSDDLMERMRRLAPPAASQPATGAPASGSAQAPAEDAAPSSDDLMARMNAIAPAPKQTGTAPAAKDWRDDYPASDPGDIVPSPAVMGAFSRIGQAAAEGSAEGPHIPRVPGNLVMSAVYNPLIAGAEAALRGVSALGRGGMQAIYEAGESAGRAIPEVSIPNITLPSDSSITYPGGITIDRPGRGFGGTVAGGPGLGRDLNLLAQVVPVAQAEGAIMRSAMRPPVAPEVNALQPKFVSERYAPAREAGATDLERIQQLIRHDESESAGIGPQTQAGVPGASEPAPAAAVPLSAEDRRWIAGTQARLEEINQANRAAGVPGSLGAAATPEELAQLTPAQMKGYRRQAELGEILAPPARELDRSIYVEGSEPTRAEYSADPAISQQESLHRERDPNSFDPRLNQNTQARVNSYENMMGTDPQIVDLKEGKSAAAERDGAAYIQAARPLDFQPALEWLDGKLADPRIQERPEVRDVLTKLRESLFDENDQLKTDPRAGWGMHDNMINRLDKAGDRTSAERYAITQMKEYKDIIDGVNNTASDGAFQTFLDNQSHYAQQINSMEELQKFRPRFTNTKGEINANAFHKFVTDLAIRRGRPGVDAAMDISDETMRGLINIDKDLKRATNIDLGKARGSNTNLLFTLAQAAGLGAAHLGVAAMTHGAQTANLFLQGALNQAGRMTGNVLLRRAVRRGLAPPPGGYDYNPLQQGPP